MNTDNNQNQGKQGTAKTDATYERDAEALKNSSTTSQNSATSPGNVGAGGIMGNADDSGALKSMKNSDIDKLNPKEPMSEGRIVDNDE